MNEGVNKFMESMGEYTAIICSIESGGTILTVEGTRMPQRTHLGNYIGLEVKAGRMKIIISLSKDGSRLYLDQTRSIFRTGSKLAESGGRILMIELVPRDKKAPDQLNPK